MSKKKKAEEASEGLPEWFGTYSDLVTLLLCFFILLFSMASLDAQKYVQIASSLRSSFMKISGGDMMMSNTGQQMLNITNQQNPSNTGDESTDTEKYVQEAEKMVTDAKEQLENKKIEEAANKIRDIIAERGLADKISVIEEKDFLLVRLESEVLFQSGSADVLEAGHEMLSSMTDVLNLLENKDILVQGHTDNIPIQTAAFPSNWELSTARATNVVRFMIDKMGMDPARVTATGNGEFRPVADNAGAEGRQKNRRIDIRILR